MQKFWKENAKHWEKQNCCNFSIPNTAKTLNEQCHFDFNNNHHQTKHPNKPKTWEEITQMPGEKSSRHSANWTEQKEKFLLQFSAATSACSNSCVLHIRQIAPSSWVY